MILSYLRKFLYKLVKEEKLNAKDKNVTESGSDKRIPRNRGRLPKSGKDLDDGKLFYD